MSKDWVDNKIIQFDYTDLNDKESLMRYCELADINLTSIPHSNMKNYVMNYLYMSKDLKDREIIVFMFLYDFKSQQKYLPWFVVNNRKLAYMLWIHETTVSKSINKLIEFNLLVIGKNKFNEKVLLINENINTWKINLYENELSSLEEFRKHCASSNVQLSEEYKTYKKKHILHEDVSNKKDEGNV